MRGTEVFQCPPPPHTHHTHHTCIATAMDQFSSLKALDKSGVRIGEIPVALNYDIIRLFSEGLYKSPHKAVEELVTNSYDANAKEVHVLLPEEDQLDSAPLWVIDDGSGMNEGGFELLWSIAQSTKTDQQANGRLPIGQFGIGKLAAYVLARRLTHISCVGGTIRMVMMNFGKVKARMTDPDEPFTVVLREVDRSQAEGHLSGIRQRSPSGLEADVRPWSRELDGCCSFRIQGSVFEARARQASLGAEHRLAPGDEFQDLAGR